MSGARENSVTQLCELYTVVIGIALSIAIYDTVDAHAYPVPLKTGHLVNIAAFLAVIIPFYHGAVRHLFATYVEDGGSTRIKNGALMADFVLLFVEGCFFVTMASVIEETRTFLWVLVALLILDSVWGFLAWLAFTGANAQFAERKWAIVNVFASAVLALMGIFGDGVIGGSPVLGQVAIFIVMIVRTIVDYVLCWEFYYPARPLTASE